VWSALKVLLQHRHLQTHSTFSREYDRVAADIDSTLRDGKLFVYGTLLLDDVISTLIGRIPYYHYATVSGWRVVRLPQRIYPGLVPGQGEANGKVSTPSHTHGEVNT
jgi:gamma-glutamylcyclotransferase (GGCT)/AIG2-like uncharacterized protein YtfP